MKRKLFILLLAVALLGLTQPVAADDFYVIAGGGRGVGTAITSVPCSIDKPGFYYLTGDLTYTGNSKPAISIASDHVTLDLMGFGLIGPGRNTNQTGIAVGMSNVEVRNGTIRDFTSGNFTDGVSVLNGNYNVRLSNLKIYDCDVGIQSDADGFIISNCEASSNKQYGIASGGSGIIDKSTCCNNTTGGFALGNFKGVITNNEATGNGTGFMLSGNSSELVDHNASISNTTNWSGLSGCTVGLNTP